MKKLLIIGWKDVTLAFRDVTAIIFMLLAPFLLTIGMGLVTGSFGSRSSGIQNIPVVLVNEDQSTLGNELVKLFESPDLAELVTPTVVDDLQTAKQMVDDDQTTAVIHIPLGFTSSIIPEQGTITEGEVVQIELYSNPTRPTGAGIIKTIVEDFLGRVEVGHISGEVTVKQLVQRGLVLPQDAVMIGAVIGARQASLIGHGTTINLKTETNTGGEVKFDPLAYMAPGFALMFLMYTVSNGGRTLLAERSQGTLPRLLISPTTSAQVLGGKVLGICLTGVLQMLILIGSSVLLFRVSWGDPLGVIVLVLAAVFAACGWGMVITSLVKTPGQVATFGSAIMLIFGLLGGSFINLSAVSTWFSVISKITPNAWGLDGFLTLALGGKLADIWLPVTALVIMGVVLISIAVIIFNRRGIAQQ